MSISSASISAYNNIDSLIKELELCLQLSKLNPNQKFEIQAKIQNIQNILFSPENQKQQKIRSMSSSLSYLLNKSY
jgi:hypothetical protein